MIRNLSDIVYPDRGLRTQLRGASLRISGATGIQTHIGSILGPHQVALSGVVPDSVDFWHASTDLDGIALHYLDYQCGAESVSVFVDEPQDTILLKFPLTGPTRVRVPEREYLVHPNEFAVVRSNKPFSTTMEGSNRHLTLAISGTWLGKYLAKRDLPLRAHGLSFDPVAYDTETDGSLLTGVVAALAFSMCRRDPALGAPGVCTPLKELITSAVLELSPEYRQASQALLEPERAPEYVLRAERFIKDHLNEPICMNDIVRHSGTTKRTLHAGFRRHRGTTPMALLKSIRLRAAKAALENSSLGDRPVTRIAMAYGFYHLGRFSQDFKEAFGILPSEVRRRHR